MTEQTRILAYAPFDAAKVSDAVKQLNGLGCRIYTSWLEDTEGRASESRDPEDGDDANGKLLADMFDSYVEAHGDKYSALQYLRDGEMFLVIDGFDPNGVLAETIDLRTE